MHSSIGCLILKLLSAREWNVMEVEIRLVLDDGSLSMSENPQSNAKGAFLALCCRSSWRSRHFFEAGSRERDAVHTRGFLILWLCLRHSWAVLAITTH